MKTYVAIILSVAVGVGIIVMLLLSSDIPNRRKNDFNRIFIENIVSPHASLKFNKLIKSIYYTNENKFFFTTDANGHLYKSDHFLTRIEREEIFINADSTISKRSRNFINDNRLFIVPEGRNELISFCLNRTFTETYSLPYIAEYVTSPKSELLIFRTREKNKVFFFSFNLYNQSFQTSEKLSLALDSTFWADGQLISDPITKRITYVPYYHNSIITFDTVFNTIAKFKTIDTLAHEIVALKNINSAPLVINQKSTSYNGLLFIASNLKADNEPNVTYRNNIPIDVYDNSTGKYLKSFYVPLSNGKLIKSFLILSNDVLIVLYHDNRVSSFRLDFAKLIGNN